jgi:hypothetical protein
MPKRTKRGKWTPQIRARFLKVLRETGNAREAYRRIGHQNMFQRRRRSDPEFARDWAAAEAEADAANRDKKSAFAGIEEAPGPMMPAEGDPTALLRPGAKTKRPEPAYAIRKTRGGRTQIALVAERNMGAEQEAEFLARLRATGNFSASALAMGFQPASLFQRMRRWPGFARNCDEALVEAGVSLDYALVAHAHVLLRDPEELGIEAESAAKFDPVTAMRILSFIDRRRTGGTLRGRRRKGPPERSFDEAVESVLAKIEAIERHRQLQARREKPDDPPPSGETERNPEA